MWLILVISVWAEPVNNFDTVEINTFGGAAARRTAVLYRHANGDIAAWRWLSKREQIPRLIRVGVYHAIWDDNGKPRQVFCRVVIYTRTVEDVELQERKKLPHWKRTKLR